MLQTTSLHRLHVGPIDLTVDAGTCVSISGKSGTGKSVLLRMIADLDPHEGDAALGGKSCAGMPAAQWRRHVGYLAAESGWWDTHVRAHFAPGIDFGALLPSLGIAADAANWPVARLSTGERQRLALLRALTPDTRVLLLDEPTSALDASSTALVEALLHRQLDQGMTILLVTHSPAQADRLASRHLDMQDGRLVEKLA
jgi:ABC-type multidrug transport system ATPase subunit